LALILTRPTTTSEEQQALLDVKVPLEQKVQVSQIASARSSEAAIATVQSVLAEVEGRRWKGVKDAPKPLETWLVNGFVSTATATVVERLRERDDVVAVIENFEVSLPEPISPTSDEILEETGDITWGIEMMKVKDVWDKGYRGDGIRIAHLDTGVEPSHPDLVGKIVEWRSFDQFGHELPGTPIFDSHLHGTHTAGTLVGGNISGMSIGVAPNARLVSAQVLPYGRGTLAQIIFGAQWAVRQGVQVLNMSLGGIGYEQAYELIVPNIFNYGVLPVVAIGNEGFGVTGSPGNMRLSCGVGAVNRQDQVADFSGGGSFDWYENGNPIRFTKPDLCAPGISIFSAIPPAYGASYSRLSGTSMATPYVTGVVALLRQARRDVSLHDLLTVIYDTCRHPYGSGRHDNRYGRGIIQADQALNRVLSLP
jgi:subtilisin family serine protease